LHTLFFPDLTESDESLVIEGDEARHAARVKRLAPGDTLRVLNGKGLIATCRVQDTRKRLALEVIERTMAPRITPQVEVWSATPKGARVEAMIDALAQVGAASWTAMSTKYGVVDPRETKLSRLDRIAAEACKQAARPWMLRIEEKSSFEQALIGAGEGASLVVADASGDSYRAIGAGRVRLLIGPEGGFTREEIAHSRDAGAQVVAFGPHTMRIEVAAPVAAAIILDAEQSTGRNATGARRE
jgi:16S rRNA (uracil1498-N3)-methyltransferase